MVKRRPPKIRDASRAARLEKKLDGLVARLNREGSRRDEYDETPQDSYEQSGHENIMVETSDPTTTTSPGEDSESTPRVVMATSSSPDSSYTDEPSLVEAETALKRFREEIVVGLGAVYFESNENFNMLMSIGIPPMCLHPSSDVLPATSREIPVPMAKYNEYCGCNAKEESCSRHSGERDCNSKGCRGKRDEPRPFTRIAHFFRLVSLPCRYISDSMHLTSGTQVFPAVKRHIL